MGRILSVKVQQTPFEPTLTNGLGTLKHGLCQRVIRPIFKGVIGARVRSLDVETATDGRRATTPCTKRPDSAVSSLRRPRSRYPTPLPLARHVRRRCSLQATDRDR